MCRVDPSREPGVKDGEQNALVLESVEQASVIREDCYKVPVRQSVGR